MERLAQATQRAYDAVPGGRNRLAIRMHRRLRLARVLSLAFLLSVVLVGVNVQPAAAFTSSSSLCGDGSFNRCPYQPSTSLMDKQIDCVHCVAAGTQAWIDFARIRSGQNNRPTQADLWTYFGAKHGAWNPGAPYNTNFITRQYNQPFPTSCLTYSDYRRAANVSLDDGVDPYGQAWAMWNQTPWGYYYHQNVFKDGVPFYGRDYASHSMAFALRKYSEPVGVNIHNGGHFVLVTYVNSVQDPMDAYWTTINSVAYRDPLREVGYQRIEYLWSDWWNVLTPYGYNGETPTSPFNCHVPGNDPNATNANCQDETHFGQWADTLWWGGFVLIERDDTSANDPDWVWRFQQ